jgi:glutathione S-transferase
LLPDTKLLRSLWSRGVPRLEAGLVPVIAPMARYLAKAGYRITPETAQRSLARVRGVFQEVEERLSDGRRFLVDQRFTAADLTFAALAAPVLFPAECRAVQPELDAVPVAMRDEILHMRGTNAGRFALRLFAHERGG